MLPMTERYVDGRRHSRGFVRVAEVLYYTRRTSLRLVGPKYRCLYTRGRSHNESVGMSQRGSVLQVRQRPYSHKVGNEAVHVQLLEAARSIECSCDACR